MRYPDKYEGNRREELSKLRRELRAAGAYRSACREAMSIVGLTDSADLLPSAVSALTKKLAEVEAEVERLRDRLEKLEAAARDFVSKVETGRAHSRDSYNKFKDALGD